MPRSGVQVPPPAPFYGDLMSRFALILDYSFSAVSKNWKAVLVFFLIILLLVILHLVPFLSAVGQVVLSLVVAQLEVYYGKEFIRARSREDLISFIENSSVKKIFSENIQVSSGLFLASFLVTTLLSVLSVALLFLTGLIYDFKNLETLQGVLGYALLYLLIVITLWSTYLYLYPLGVGYVLTKEGFGEAFLGFFRIFTPTFLAKSFSFAYFKLVFLGGILFTVFSLLGIIFAVTVILLPLAAAVFYMLAVFFGALSAECYRVTFLEPDNGAGVDQ